jgi:hypothetical protein
VGIYSQYFIPEIGLETVHYGKDNYKCGDTQEYPGNGYECDNGDKNMLSLGPEVSETDKKFEGHD